MEARELILGMLADVRCESGSYTRSAQFQPAKGIQITLGCRILKLFSPHWLERTQRFGFTTQNKVADRPAVKSIDLARKRRANTNPGPEVFVGSLEPRRNIDGVAVCGVVEEALSAEVADDR